VDDGDLQLVLGRMAWYVAAGRLAAVVAGPLTGAKLDCVSMHVVRKQIERQLLILPRVRRSVVDNGALLGLDTGERSLGGNDGQDTAHGGAESLRWWGRVAQTCTLAGDEGGAERRQQETGVHCDGCRERTWFGG